MEPITREGNMWSFIELCSSKPVRSYIRNGICVDCNARDVVKDLKNDLMC